MAFYDTITSLKYSGTMTTLPKLSDTIIELNCSYNSLVEIVALPARLRRLICKHNQLQKLPELPDTLIELRCSHNLLTSLPKLPRGLDILCCEYNSLTSLPELPENLFTLCIDNNLLTQIPETPYGLQILTCDNNKISSFPILYNLIELSCKGNNFIKQPIIDRRFPSLLEIATRVYGERCGILEIDDRICACYHCSSVCIVRDCILIGNISNIEIPMRCNLCYYCISEIETI